MSNYDEVALTEKEIKIIELVAQDLSDKEIADQLNISVRTVSNYLRTLYTKLEVKGRAGAVVKAAAQDFLDLKKLTPNNL